ncbi:MAG: bifunctional pyr operon transcriptional regulator/uracil phosphoribosyltransferase PyrR [Cytophagaceae bacterium]|nr:bifunctional pyr operon transcriptional regulator/uracil phosphoribosyltransferase PyrR [Cytophagaceae bacterium]MBK9511209.1 bifunctional pyr operon transcriptional regulator/uracil phosphoribosyltransferase PyrR [Cytophagaceae bacterium]MBK9933073.1 bifunctional pyr operon transcriptional regulator/uracil phosphoribosyltransferase PyrR [Cytophagaceae bacterium]MBL0303209.1 bifunctional pyr operon transcriptional regulator/uracil phosphoribosyltransferase PyrR [Cytophagaceae bacterium]
MQKKRLILSQPLLDITIRRLCQEIIENHDALNETVLMGLQPRGVFLAERIQRTLKEEFGTDLKLGLLDATFYRDDFKRKGNILKPNSTRINFIIEEKNVILIDDVLATGRMVRAAIDAMQAFGRPLKVELLCLINRKYNRDLPIQPDFSGMKVNTLDTQRVLVEWTEQGFETDSIWLID